MALFGQRDNVRARFYGSLATAIDAGLTLDAALGLIREPPFAEPARRIHAAVQAGRSLAEAMAAQKGVFSPFETRALAAGETGGRLVDACRRLARHFEDRGRTQARLGNALIYPVVLLHMAILLPPAFVWFRDGLGAYLGTVLPAFVGLYALAGVCVFLFRMLAADQTRCEGVARFSLGLPVAGPILRGLALSDYAYITGALLSSGVPMVEALRQAAGANRNALFRSAARRVARAVERGCSLWEALAAEDAVFPRLVVETVKVGETAGRLDDALERVERTCREDTERAVDLLARLLPVAALLVVGAIVAWVVITSFSGIFSQIP